MEEAISMRVEIERLENELAKKEKAARSAEQTLSKSVFENRQLLQKVDMMSEEITELRKELDLKSQGVISPRLQKAVAFKYSLGDQNPNTVVDKMI